MSKSLEANASKVTTEVHTSPTISVADPRLTGTLDFEICEISSSVPEVCLGTLSLYAQDDGLAGRTRQ
jgi:hypothetical protein